MSTKTKAAPTIGQWVSQKRYEAGMSQRDLAEAAGITRGALSNIENDRWTPSADTLGTLAVAIETHN